MNAPGIETIPLPGRNLAGAVANHILGIHNKALPDLSGLVVLVPNHRAGADFARLLAAAAGRPALIPPRITPLKTWASNKLPEPHNRRLARLHGALKQQTWLVKVDRWALAGELLQICDELSAARLGLEEFAARLHGINLQPLERETALIETVWRTMNADGIDPQACYAHGLSGIQPDRPVFGFALGPLTRLEHEFLQRYAQHAPVTLFTLDATEDAVTSSLAKAWINTSVPLLERSVRLAGMHPRSSVSGCLKIYPAPHLEAEARAITSWVAAQLQAGRKRVALIALDRETARRARAMLERLDVLVADETGWTLSTTAAAAVIDRWLDCIDGDFPHAELLDLLKSPFALTQFPERQDAVLSLEALMRRHGVSQGMNEIRRLANDIDTATGFLDILAQAAESFSQSRTPLAVWLGRLLTSLAQIGAVDALAADPAGSTLLDALERLQEELATDREKYQFSEWRRWLNLALESETFTDTSVESSVVLTSLPNSRGRVFEAVALIGADAAHLPAPPAASLFNQSIRAQLGLPVATDTAAQAAEDLLLLLAQGPSLMTWQAWHNDEPNPASSFVLRLQALHQAAWNQPMEEQDIGLLPAHTAGHLDVTQQPAPVAPPQALPRRYSASAYQTLLDCPYKFFSRHVLGLRELDEADEPLDKSDYGNILHRILKSFHDSMPPHNAEAAMARLEEISAAEFVRLPAYTAAAWQSRWRWIQPAYIDAWLEWTRHGWQYQSGETDFARTQAIENLGEITLHGRIDRVDTRLAPQGKPVLAVIDYKTTQPGTLKRKIKNPAEAVQLPFYAWLADAEAAFLPLSETGVSPLPLDAETDVAAISQRLPLLLEKIARGSALPANGIEPSCKYCEARGLCRKGTWNDQPS